MTSTTRGMLWKLFVACALAGAACVANAGALSVEYLIGTTSSTPLPKFVVSAMNSKPYPRVEMDGRRVGRVQLEDGTMIVYQYQNGELAGIMLDDLQGRVERSVSGVLSVRLGDGSLVEPPEAFSVYASSIRARIAAGGAKWVPPFDDETFTSTGDMEWTAWDSYGQWNSWYLYSDDYYYDLANGGNREACIRMCSAIGTAWARACLAAGPAAPECFAAAEAFTLLCVISCEATY